MSTRQLFALILLSSCILIGCSKKSAPATVSGTVTYNDAPVTGGRLDFHSEAGVYSADIGADGKYSIADIPTGEMTVTVDTEGLNPNVKKQTYSGQAGGAPKGGKGMSGSGPPSSPKGTFQGKGEKSSPMPEGASDAKQGNYVKIPRTYADKTKSTLKVTVNQGVQVIDIPLKD